MVETVHIFCENCGSSCEVLFDREDDNQEVIFCPFCGEESLDEELLEPEELDDNLEDGFNDSEDEDEDEDE